MTLSLARFAGLAAATVAAVCGLGVWPTIQFGGVGSLLGMAGAALLAVVGSIGGYLPLLSSAAARSTEARAQAWMIGLGVRLFLTLVVLLAVWSAGVPHREALLAWTGVLYLVLLVLETVVVVRSIGVAPSPSPKFPGTSA